MARRSALARFLDWLFFGPKETRRTRPPKVRARRPQRRRQQENDEALARRLERGEIRGEALRELFRTGRVRIRRNPRGDALTVARRAAEQFHGTADRTVIELAPDERPQGTGRYWVLVGELASLTYLPPAHSRRGGTLWEHHSGDRGAGKPRARHRPLLVADPVTGRVAIVKHRSPLRFDPRKGLVG